MTKFKIGIIDWDFKKIVSKELRKESRKEAIEIISHCLSNLDNKFKNNETGKDLIVELLFYHEKKMDNIFCLQLDKIKSLLVEYKFMKQHATDSFGGHLIPEKS